MSLAESDAALAARLAAAAGDILLSLRSDGRHVGVDLGKAGDEAANEYLIRELRNARPFDAILSEEEKDSAARLDHRRVWIIAASGSSTLSMGPANIAKGAMIGPCMSACRLAEGQKLARWLCLRCKWY